MPLRNFDEKAMKVWKTAVTLVLFSSLVACQTSHEEKIKRVVEGQVAKCKAAEGTFYDIELDDEKHPILREVCSMPIDNIKQTDEFHGVAKTGPYDWLLSIDKETAVWVLNAVDYEPMTDALSALAASDPDETTMSKAVNALGEAEKGLPDSEWVRVTRVEQAFQLRDKQRGKDKDDPTGLGSAREIYEANLAWAKQKDPNVQAKIQLAFINAYKKYMFKLQDAFDGLGGQDDWYEASIRAAEKEKDTKTVEEYTAELAKLRAERPAEKKMLMDRKALAFDMVCKTISELPTVTDAEVGKAVDAAKTMNCAPDARPKYEEAAEP